MNGFKKKFGKRILAYLLSGAMIMSNMTAFASEATQDTGGGYYEEAFEEDAEAVEASENGDNDSDKQDDVKESSVESSEQTTEASDDEQTSETESSLSAETENVEEVSTEKVSTEEVSTEEATEAETESTEDVSTEEVSEAETTEVSEADEDVKAASLTDSALNEYVDKTVGEWTEGSDGTESRETKWDFSKRRPDDSVVMAVNDNLQGIVALAGKVAYKVKTDSDTKVKTNEGFGVPKDSSAAILLDSETTSVAIKFTLSGTTSGRKVKIGGVEIDHAKNYDSADTVLAITSDDNYGKYLKIEGMTNGDGYTKEGDTKFAEITIIETRPASGGSGGIDTTHTNWKFSDSDFQTDANKESVSDYNGLKIESTNAKAHNGKYFYVKSGKVSIPVAGNSTVTVKAQYGNKFYFAEDSDDVKEGSGETISEYTYEYKGGKGYVVLTVLDTTYFTEINVEVKAETPQKPTASVSGKNKDGKPDVWDFAAGATKVDDSGNPTEYIDTTVYNNMLTEDIINGWFPDVAAGTANTNTSSFAVKNDKDEVMFEFNGNGKTNNRIRTKNTKLTRYDNSSKKDADGTEYLGYVYSNSASTADVYLGIMLEEGDIVTAVVSSNGNASTIKFAPVDGSAEAQTYQYKPADNVTAGVATFYATKNAEYKMYSTDEKLVVARVTVEKTDFVRVSGKVTAPESLTKEYSVAFTCRETGAVKTAKVSKGEYVVYLNEEYTYDVSLSDANGYVVENEQPYFTLAGDIIKEEEIEGEKEKTYAYDVNVKAVDLVTVTGNITGLAAVAGGEQNPLKNLKLTFESDKIYVPEMTVSAEGAFTLVLEKGVEYTVKEEGIDDFILNTTTISATENKTANIEFAAKPVYNVTIVPEGATADELKTTNFVFSRVGVVDNVKEYDKNYVYTFTGTEGIKLRDGQYEVKAANCPYTQELTSDLKVAGADVTKTVKFNKNPITLWDFADADFTDVTNYKGLLMSGVSKNKTYALGGASGEYKVPVAGPCTLTAYYCYEATGTIEDSAVISVTEAEDKESGFWHSTTKEKSTTYDYTGEGGYVTIKTTATTYMTKITVVYAAGKSEYKEKITVGAEGCDYTSVNDALDAVRNMDRPNNERVTIEIQPDDYEEMLVIDTPNVTLKNAHANASIMPVNKGVDIAASSVRITSYYGHGYAYYSMGSDCKWNADLLAINKENGCLSFENPGTGTTSGSYWNATVVVAADGFEADGIIFENSFNQYMSKKAADDVIVPLSGAKGENLGARNDMQAGDTSVQYKDYVERAAALAIKDNYKNISFNNCSFIGRQDTLFGGVDAMAAFYACDVYGGTDYIFGGMTAVFAKCNLVFNTNDQTDNAKNDVGYITAPQTASGRGYLMYNCTVTSTTPNLNTASKKTSKPGLFGRPWKADTGEALFYKTIIGTTTYNGKKESLIQPIGWNDGLSGKSKLSQEYASIELAGVDNSANRAEWASMLTADAAGNVTLADGNTVVTDSTVVAAFLGEWNPFDGKDMTIATEGKPEPKPIPENVTTIRLTNKNFVIAVPSILADTKNPDNKPNVSVVYYTDKDENGNLIHPVTFAEGLDFTVSKPEKVDGTDTRLYSVTITGNGRTVDSYRIDPTSSVIKTFRVFQKNDSDVIDLSKAKITLDGTAKNAVYTGYGITPGVEVKVGKIDIPKENYKVSYKSNVNAGKATVIVSADSSVAYDNGEKFIIGSKTATFTIKKAAINKNDQITVTALDINGKTFGSEKYDYRGAEAVVIEDLSVVTKDGKALREGIDYTLTYKNNRKAGKATATIKGIGNNVSGTLNIPFTINPIVVDPEKDTWAPYYGFDYTPNGAKAQYIVLQRYKDAAHTELIDAILLEEGVDFKGTYKYPEGKEAGKPVKFSGKGMNAFQGGFKEAEFTIKRIDFILGVYVSNDAIIVDVTKGDLAGDNLKKALEKAVVVKDYFGTKLKLTKDYQITVDEAAGIVSISPSSATIANYVEPNPALRYYYDKAKNIGKVKVEFAKTFVKDYDGRNPVELDADDISELVDGDHKLELGTDVEIVEGSYKNNYKTGTASVTIRGISENGYYGTKVIKFKIKEV